MMGVFESLLGTKLRRGGGFLLLLDPDRSSIEELTFLAEAAADCEVDAILVGTSFMLKANFHDCLKDIKRCTPLPVILFPGAHSQISPFADAVLFISLISGRNPYYLIDEQVRGAPLIKELGIESIATGYMLIESGGYSSVQYISGTMPIPSSKNDIACAHALAAQYLGMKLIYMEAGSGAERAVPDAMIEAVTKYIELPVLVGGGIRSPGEVEKKIEAGASFVVVGSHFENKRDVGAIAEFAVAAHPRENVRV
jgi:phosphoglycerol geranylgeranyltransferase